MIWLWIWNWVQPRHSKTSPPPKSPHTCSHTPQCLSELKLQLQSSFETEESSPEREQRPSELVKLLPAVFSDDQVVAPANTETIEEVSESPCLPNGLQYNTNCPLSQELRDQRLETRRFCTIYLAVYITIAFWHDKNAFVLSFYSLFHLLTWGFLFFSPLSIMGFKM